MKAGLDYFSTQLGTTYSVPYVLLHKYFKVLYFSLLSYYMYGTIYRMFPAILLSVVQISSGVLVALHMLYKMLKFPQVISGYPLQIFRLFQVQ